MMALIDINETGHTHGDQMMHTGVGYIPRIHFEEAHHGGCLRRESLGKGENHLICRDTLLC